MPNVLKSSPQLSFESPINPRTGRVWSLADEEVQPQIDAMEKELDDPEKARAFLRQVGLIDKKGNLTKRYGG